MVHLIPPAEAIDDPLGWALRGESRLAGMACPSMAFDFPSLSRLHGLGAVVSLLGDVAYDCSPLQLVKFSLEDLFGGKVPADPDAERETVTAAALEVREMLNADRGVVVHCAGGTGRTGTVIGAVLVSYGLLASQVEAWLDEVHRARGRSGWPESPWQREALVVLV